MAGHAIKSRARFVRRAVAEGLPTLWWVIGLAALLIGGSVLAFVALALHRPQLALIVAVAALVLTFAEGAYRLRDQRASDAADDPGALLREYSNWLVAQRAALPTSPGVGLLMSGMGLLGEARELHRAETEGVKVRYREKYREVERQTRADYHDKWRDRIVAVIGDVRGVQDPRTLEDLELIEKALKAELGEDPQP